MRFSSLEYWRALSFADRKIKPILYWAKLIAIKTKKQIVFSPLTSSTHSHRKPYQAQTMIIHLSPNSVKISQKQLMPVTQVWIKKTEIELCIPAPQKTTSTRWLLDSFYPQPAERRPILQWMHQKQTGKHACDTVPVVKNRSGAHRGVPTSLFRIHKIAKRDEELEQSKKIGQKCWAAESVEIGEWVLS